MLDSFKLIQHILDQLFAAEQRRLQRKIDELHKSNQELHREKLDGFLYMGVPYFPADALAGSRAKKTLHLRLWPDMDEHLADKQKVELDRNLIHQVLFRAIEPCHCIEHVRDAIPDCIADTLPEPLASMERRGGPNWYTERDLKQWNKAMPLVELYSATRLIY
jgi:hypothetical protein